jgi:arylsulfatase A-like enzyme
VGHLMADDSRPNVILIMPDDMGIDDFGIPGNAAIRTPQVVCR